MVRKIYSRDIYEVQAEMIKAITNPKRIQIISILNNKEMTVNEIKDALGIEQSNASQHLAILKSKGVLKSRREGNNVYYRVAMPELTQACNLVKNAIIRIREESSLPIEE